MSVRLPPLGALLWPSWAVLGASWTVLGPSWEPVGPSRRSLGGLLGRLTRRESRQVVYAKNTRFPQGVGRFWPLGAFSGVPSEASWTVWKQARRPY